MSRIVLLIEISLTLLVLSCLPEYNFVPLPGDLLFQDLDCGSFCEAIEKVTEGYNGANFSHVGIVAKDTTETLAVIEAIQSGVTITPLDTFLNRSLDQDKKPKVVVGRLRKKYSNLISEALKEALALVGQPYDRAFDIENDKYYCSELIYEVFLRANHNAPIFSLQPMTFKDPATGNTFPIWEDYFMELGVAIPEGELGINPGSISRSPIVKIVYEYSSPNSWN